MALNEDRLRDEPRKIRKSIRKLPADMSMERVHQVRTRIRRLEATLHTLECDSRKNERSLLKALKPVRRNAGKVRDLDVLTQFASGLHVDGENECSVRLLEHLGAERDVRARKLGKVAAKQGREVTRRLKRCERFFEKALQPGSRRGETTWPAQSAALALRLTGELRDWPSLNAKNLHPFRLKVKELRYILQMARERDEEFVSVLGEVKDTTGEWHDWEELRAIAQELIQHPRCALLKEIRSVVKKKFEQGMAVATRMRKENLGVAEGRQRGQVRRFPRKSAAVRSVTSLAA